MRAALSQALSSIRFRSREWEFVDLRINVPPRSFGSDAINPHTQYSNPIAVFECGGVRAIGASFTLGEGNQMLCEAANYIVRQFEGMTVADLISSGQGFHERLANPLQLRWLSPNAGVPLMAAGLVANTLIDAAAKACEMPAWEYLARLPSDFLLSLMQQRHLPRRHNLAATKEILDSGLRSIDSRCEELRHSGLPVYYTTWIGHDAETIAAQITQQHKDRGIRQFKIKIGTDLEGDIDKLRGISAYAPKGIILCVDANQTLDFDQAARWMEELSHLGVLWLEEPFAPDNTALFRALAELKKRKGWTCEIVTGENCPNTHTAAALMESGIDRFQADPCRMLGLIDAMQTCCIARTEGCVITPHAGGASLDEQSPHIQMWNLARVWPDAALEDSLTENVGFCSRYFAAPTIVEDGRARAPKSPGFLVGLAPEVQSSIQSYRDGCTWLEL